MTIDIKRIRALADKALSYGTTRTEHARSARNMFIAAANPQTVIALLDEVERLSAPEAHWECQQRIDVLEQQLANVNSSLCHALRMQDKYKEQADNGPLSWNARNDRLLAERDEARSQLAAAQKERDELAEAVVNGPLNGRTTHDEIVALRHQLAAMTATRNVACDLAIKLVEQLVGEPVP